MATEEEKSRKIMHAQLTQTGRDLTELWSEPPPSSHVKTTHMSELISHVLDYVYAGSTSETGCPHHDGDE